MALDVTEARLVELYHFLVLQAERRLAWTIRRGGYAGPLLGKEAADFASETLLLVADGTRMIDPDKPLEGELRDVLLSLISGHARRRENATGVTLDELPEVADPAVNTLVYQDLDERLRNDDDLRPILRLSWEGYDRPRDFARLLEISEEEFVNRRKRLRRLMTGWGYAPGGAS